MRGLALVAILGAACGHSSSPQNGDGDGGVIGDGAGGDGNGGGGDGGVTGPSTIALTLTNRPNTPSTFAFLVAYQDGAGPWTLAPAPMGDTYHFTISSPVWAAAWTCIPRTPITGTSAAVLQRTVTSVQFAAAERTSFTTQIADACTDRVTTVSLVGQVLNASGDMNATELVQFGTHTAAVSGSGFLLQTPPGTHDLFAAEIDSHNGNKLDGVVTTTVIARALAVTTSTTQSLDFDNGAQTRTFDVTGTGMAMASLAQTILYSAGGTPIGLAHETSPPFDTVALATSQAATGDVYDREVAFAGTGHTEAVTSAVATPAAFTYAAPAPLGLAMAITASPLPYPLLAAKWLPYSNAVGYTWTATQTLPEQVCGLLQQCAVVWTAVLSPGVTGGSPSYQMPDLSGLAGWNAGLQPVTGTAVTGTITAMTSTGGANDFPPGVPTTGTRRIFAQDTWSVTP